MLLKELISIIEKNYPIEYAYEWDNPGLLLGDFNRDIKKAAVSLDLTEEILDNALKTGIDCIISHHPLIFSGMKKINTETKTGSMLLKAAENKIAIYAAHTNMDVAPAGINKKLSEMFKLENSEIIEPNSSYPDTGLGRIGNIKEIQLCDFLHEVKKILNTPYVRFSGNEAQLIRRVAIGSGSCSELIPKAIELGADTIITADLKYHTCLDYTSDSFSIIDAGHYPTENIVTDMFSQILSDTDIEIVKPSQYDIFKFI